MFGAIVRKRCVVLHKNEQTLWILGAARVLGSHLLISLLSHETSAQDPEKATSPRQAGLTTGLSVICSGTAED